MFIHISHSCYQYTALDLSAISYKIYMLFYLFLPKELSCWSHSHIAQVICPGLHSKFFSSLQTQGQNPRDPWHTRWTSALFHKCIHWMLGAACKRTDIWMETSLSPQSLFFDFLERALFEKLCYKPCVITNLSQAITHLLLQRLNSYCFHFSSQSSHSPQSSRAI